MTTPLSCIFSLSCLLLEWHLYIHSSHHGLGRNAIGTSVAPSCTSFLNDFCMEHVWQVRQSVRQAGIPITNMTSSSISIYFSWATVLSVSVDILLWCVSFFPLLAVYFLTIYIYITWVTSLCQKVWPCVPILGLMPSFPITIAIENWNRYTDSRPTVYSSNQLLMTPGPPWVSITLVLVLHYRRFEIKHPGEAVLSLSTTHRGIPLVVVVLVWIPLEVLVVVLCGSSVVLGWSVHTCV